MSTLRIARPAVAGPRGLGGERLRTVVVMALAGVAILAAATLLDRSAAGYSTVNLTGDTSGPRPAVGGGPPDFSATTVGGEAFSLADLSGRPVWLTFGASWCADCRAEAPDVQAAYERFAPAGLALVSVWIDESDADVRDYASRVGLTFTMIADPSTTLASRYRIYGLPTHYFITPDGVIREIRLGGLPPDAMDRLVGSIMP